MGLIEDGATGPVAPPPALVKFAVEIGGLSDFAGFVDREVGGNIDPAVQSIGVDHIDGLHWGVRLGSGLGHQASEVVNVARLGHNEARRQSIQNMARYIQAAQAMVTAIHGLMTTYETGEQLATLTPDLISGLVSQAYQGQPPPPRTPHDPTL